MFAIAQETAMATLKITDEFGLNTTVQFRDDSPLALSKLIHIAAVGQGLKNEIDKPIDQTFLKGFTFGADWSSPTSTIGDVAKVTEGAGVGGAISIVRPVDKTLFPDDDFAPTITLTPDQCWVGIEIDASTDASLKVSADGFGVGIAGTAKLGLTTYTLIHKSSGQFPALLDGLKTALDGFSVASTAEALRKQPTGIVCVSELGGTVTISSSYQFPVSINPLASADLPFNYKISVQPEGTLKLAGSIAFSGDLIVRAHKLTDTTLEIGVYKKKGSTLSASFTAATGVGIDLGTTDLAAAILNTALPGANSKGAGINGGSAEELNAALKDCIDRSLSIAMNVSCSAATTDEAAVIYHVDLSAGNTDATNAALKSALQGDWTLLTRLPNAQLLRNIVTDSKEYKHKTAINLFGIYNAEDVDTYVQSCTILHDENGHVSVIDKASASRISVAAMPYAADVDKLRTALAQDFLATVSYAVVASKIQPALAIQQSYFLYDKALSRQKMLDQILLGAALRLFAKADWNATLTDNSVFPHAHISASAKYKDANILSLFFSDPTQRKPRSRAAIERAGRNAMIASIDPGDPAGVQRLAVLNNDQIWNAMDSNGNKANFRTIAGLTQLALPVLEAVGTDWEAITWWADATEQVPPKLADTLAFLATLPASGDFSTNPDFLAKTKALQRVLGGVAKKTHAAFAGAWGMAVVFTLAGTGAERSIDISWSSTSKHYEANS
jgi:hypothetical protein